MRGEGRARLAGPSAARRGLHGGPRRPRLFLVSRRADARAAPYTSDIYKERLENQGKTKQTKKRSQGATAKDVRAQSFGGTPSASGGVTLRGGNGPAGAGPGRRRRPGRHRRANDARSVRPALRGRRFAGLASPGVPWSKVRLSSDESSGPPRMSSKNGSWQSSATVDRRSGTSCVEINQRVRLC